MGYGKKKSPTRTSQHVGHRRTNTQKKSHARAKQTCQLDTHAYNARTTLSTRSRVRCESAEKFAFARRRRRQSPKTSCTCPGPRPARINIYCPSAAAACCRPPTAGVIGIGHGAAASFGSNCDVSIPGPPVCRTCACVCVRTTQTTQHKTLAHQKAYRIFGSTARLDKT